MVSSFLTHETMSAETGVRVVIRDRSIRFHVACFTDPFFFVPHSEEGSAETGIFVLIRDRSICFRAACFTDMVSSFLTRETMSAETGPSGP